MKTVIELPKAFSVNHENEMFVVQHLLTRLNPDLLVTQVATGVHVNGGATAIWALAYHGAETLTEEEVRAALVEAGLDLEHNAELLASRVWVNNHTDLVEKSNA